MIVVLIVDALCALLFIAGLTVVVRGARKNGDGAEQEGPTAGTYATRIAGTMMAFFGLALATLMTLFYFLSR